MWELRSPVAREVPDDLRNDEVVGRVVQADAHGGAVIPHAFFGSPYLPARELEIKVTLPGEPEVFRGTEVMGAVFDSAFVGFVLAVHGRVLVVR